MSVTDKLTPEAEEQRARLEEQLPQAGFDADENGNRKYKNLGAHVLPLLRILGLQISRVYSSRDISDDLCSGLGIHDMAIFNYNNYRQRDRTCVPNTDTQRIRNATNRTRGSAGAWIQNVRE